MRGRGRRTGGNVNGRYFVLDGYLSVCAKWKGVIGGHGQGVPIGERV